MSDLTLYIGNQNYSSWSFRPWFAMTAAGIAFRHVVIPFDFPAGNPEFFKLSPVGRVPVLHHGDVRVWESLAIIEYVADLFPEPASGPRRAPTAPWPARSRWKCSPASARCATPAP